MGKKGSMNESKKDTLERDIYIKDQILNKTNSSFWFFNGFSESSLYVKTKDRNHSRKISTEEAAYYC